MARPRLPTSADVARESGFSRATVSYALNPATAWKVSARTVKLVSETAERLGYIPSWTAHALRRGRSDTVIAVAPRIMNEPTMRLLDHLGPILADRGFLLVPHMFASVSQLSELAARIGASSVIAFVPLSAEDLTRLRSAGVQTFLTLPADAGRPLGLPWEYPAGQLQIDHLAREGFRRFACVSLRDAPYPFIARERLRGAEIACLNLGLPAPLPIELPHVHAESGELLKTLRGEDGRLGVAAADDLTALFVLGACASSGLSVPEDIGVIGFGDSTVARLARPGITSISRDVEDLAVATAKHFLSLADDASEHLRIDVDLELHLSARSS